MNGLCHRLDMNDRRLPWPCQDLSLSKGYLATGLMQASRYSEPENYYRAVVEVLPDTVTTATAAMTTVYI
jgi:hypothetical protein